MPVTAQYLMNYMARCLPIGDIVLVPGLVGPEEARQLLNLFDVGDFITSLADEIPSLKNYQSTIKKNRLNKFDGAEQLLLIALLNDLWQEYVRFRAENYSKDSLEPAWFLRLPKLIKGHLRTQFQFNLEEPCLNLIIDVPYTGIRFMYAPVVATATTEFLKKKGAKRLQFINQLPNLLYPNLKGASLRKRYNHSLGAGAVVRVIAFNNCRVLHPWLRHTLHIAENLHDIATCAGGDGIKSLDLPHLCEEKNAGDVLLRNQWKRYFRETGTSSRLVIDIIQNRDEFGLGNCANEADRIDYVAGDLHDLIRNSGLTRNESPIINFFCDHPAALTVWDCIKLIPTGKRFKTVYTDPSRLADFLELRTLMHVHYYYNQKSRSKNAVWINLPSSFLYSKEKISAQELRRMTDVRINKIVENFLQADQRSLDDPLTETHANYRESLNRELQLLKEGSLSVSEHCIINTAIDETLTLTSSGEIVSFREANPEKSRELESLAGIKKPYYVHYVRDPKIGPEILKELMEFRTQQVKKLLSQT